MAYINTIKKPHYAKVQFDKNELYDLYVGRQWSMGQIGKKLNASRQCIARWLNFWGIELRTGAEGAAITLERRNGSRSPNWRGGTWYSPALDTWFTYAPNHPNRNQKSAVPTHILVAERRIGRYLRRGEVVHHLDLDRSNNDWENLCVMPRGTHLVLHRVLGEVGIRLVCAGHTERVMRTIINENHKRLVLAVYVEKWALVEWRSEDVR